jgi:hypothetical protein
MNEHENVQQPKGRGVDDEEVARKDRLGVVSQKCPQR